MKDLNSIFFDAFTWGMRRASEIATCEHVGGAELTTRIASRLRQILDWDYEDAWGPSDQLAGLECNLLHEPGEIKAAGLALLEQARQDHPSASNQLAFIDRALAAAGAG